MSDDDRSRSKGGRLSAGKQKAPRGAGPMWARAEKPVNMKGSLLKLLRYMGRYRFVLMFGIFLVMMASVCSVVGPQFLRTISDMIYDGITDGVMDMDGIGHLALLCVCVYVLSMVLNIAEHYLSPYVSECVANMIRNDLAEKINRVPLNYYDNSSTGDVMSRITNDADTIGDQCGVAFAMFFGAVTTLIGCVVMMFYTNAVLAVITVIPPVLGFVAVRFIIHKTQKLFLAQSRNLGMINGHVEETYYGHDIVKTYNGEEESRRRFSEINDELYRTTYRSRFITSTIPQVMSFINNLGYVLVCVVGSMMILSGHITYGVIVAFIVYVRMFSNPLMMITDAISSMQSVVASSERVFELLDAPEMEDESHKNVALGKVSGEVEFRDVCFSYIEGIEVIHDFSLTVKPGEKVAIVGPTGAGKTTIVNLLMRFYELDSGSILIDGIPTTDLRRGQVHSLFSMVLQDAWLFDGTIRENLKFNVPDTPDEVIENACMAVGIHDFIMTLPKGYDTVIGGSSGLSAGQKQQLSIARAIVKDAPMIIFDEATSSVDTRTEKKIQSAVDSLTAGRTSFLIAHRLSTIRDCDKILVMKDGRMVESGTHESLLEMDGFYAELYRSQFENCL